MVRSCAFAGIVGLVVVWLLPEVARAQARPFLHSMGRYTAAWSGRPLSYDQQCWDHMVNLGVKSTGAGLAWVDAEPVEGQYNWDAIAYADFEVDQILARGMEVAFFLGLTPQWAKLHPDLPPHRTPPAEDYVQQFMDFHRFVADRYRGRVKYYYFWNEPNGCSWINDGCSNSDSFPLYTQWLIRCSQAVREMDPDAKIIAGRLDYHSGVTHGYQYVQGMYDHGAGPWIDGIAIHPYNWSGGIHWQALTDTRNVMVARGDGHKPIWITEYGWNSSNYQWTADNLVQVLTELKKPEWHFIEKANYLVLNDGSGVENYGLMSANLNPRAGYYAFRDLDKSFPQTVDFAADATQGVAPLTVQFTDLSDVDEADTWFWEFGDGGTSSDQHPAYIYDEAGIYTVRLTVTGTAGPVVGEKADYITVLAAPLPCGIRNPSFEDDGGSLDEWEIVVIQGGPDNPPLGNGSFGVTTPFGNHWGGKITSGGRRDFYLGQVVCASDYQPLSSGADWQLSAWVQLRVIHENNPLPTGVHQVWELGWNNDGSLPSSIMACDQYTTIASIDGTYTGNDLNFHLLEASGTITGVGLQGVALRVRLYNDATWWWTFVNFDNVSLSVTSTPPPPHPADFDGDGDVDEDDLAFFRACVTGPAAGPPAPGCEAADLDQDGDVDHDDFGIFQRCYSGPGVLADNSCID